MKSIEEFNRRIIGLIRIKAEIYEHPARKRGEVVVGPSLDDICNELEAFFTGLSL